MQNSPTSPAGVETEETFRELKANHIEELKTYALLTEKMLLK
jgi:hypothetical protein